MVFEIVDTAQSTSFYVGGKHPSEDLKSWDLHVKRQQTDEQPENIIASTNAERILRVDVDRPSTDEGAASKTNQVPYSIKREKYAKNVPFAGGDTTHGIMIDAGSQGTRLHVYEWDKRILLNKDDLLKLAQGKKLSYPTSNSRWTDKQTPGLDAFSDHADPDELEEAIGGYLGALLDFARVVLKEKDDQWHTYPIFLKATGGMRTLPKLERVHIINCVRKLFHDKRFNPFAFEDEQARVISGEEEAIYGWVGVNFAMGTLIDESEGVGTTVYNPKPTYGMVDMGGASTQVAFVENNGDIMANLFKLQLGGGMHWDVYVHSYLYSGINGAWSRLNARLHWEGIYTNPCLPTGSSIEFSSWIHLNDEGQIYPRSHPQSTPYTITMINNENEFDFQKCSDLSYKLLRKETNKEWCDFQMDGNCGYAGIYQPPMPQLNEDIGMMIASGKFADVFEFLELEEVSTVSSVRKGAERVCRLSFEELQVYNAHLKNPVERKDLDVLKQYCFRSVFAYQMLRNGWGLGDDSEIDAVDVIDGQKLGWALGSMLYEINTLPWDFHPELVFREPNWVFICLYIVLGTLVGLTVGFVQAMKMSKKFSKNEGRYYFEQLGLTNNEILCKSTAIPDFHTKATLQEMEKLQHQEKEYYQHDACRWKYVRDAK
eukprot:jgi/Psemu1/317971/estExt_fgenesh1_pm.C_380011